jgi:triacylglycerol lipase
VPFVARPLNFFPTNKSVFLITILFMRNYLLLFLAMPFFFSCKDQEKKNETANEQHEDTVQSKTIFNDMIAAIFSQVAYCADPQKQLDKYLPGWKVVWNPLAVSGNYAFVATDGISYAIGFRGSLLSFTEDAFNNWIYNDLNVAIQDKWPFSKAAKARISQGSFIAWQNLEKAKDKVSGKTLWTFLSENVTEEKPLILSGHSLGGNLAIVYGSYLWSKFNDSVHTKKNINVITFAAPAPGNGAFADDFNTHFPSSERVENTNDIVPKFPCSKKMSNLGELYSPSPSASAISIGYKNVTTKLNVVFTLMSAAMELLELRSDFYGYTHSNGEGKLITVPLSGKNTTNSAADWFAEAGYQHSMAQYAAAIGAPLINCN